MWSWRPLGRARLAAAWLRRTHTESEGPIAPVYGITCAVAVAAPLVVGAATGHDVTAGIIALGAYFIGSSGAVVSLETTGPYGARARLLALCVVAVTLGFLAGGVLGEYPVAVTVAVPLVAAASIGFPKIGASVSLAVLVAASQPGSGHHLVNALYEGLGGVIVGLLLLAPWLTRRLQPLRLSIADAARSVAALLDVLADVSPDEQEWNKRRRRALDDIARARRVYGLYRTGARDESRRPRRLIEALQRVVGEASALHDLLPPLQQTRPHPRWERDRRVAQTAIAARLRLLADSLRTNGETPLVTGRPAALRRLGRSTELIRKAGLSGEEDLLPAALAVQVRRVMDRIMSTTDGAAEVVERGVRFRPEMPHLPSGPRFRRFARHQLATHRPEIRHAARIWLCVAAAMAIATGTGVSHGYWLTLTVMISLRDTYGSTVERVAKRVGGTAIGAVAAALALAVAPGRISLIVLIFLCVFVAFTLRTRNYAYWMMGNTPLIMLLADYGAPLDWEIAGVRIGLTAAGSALALVAARFLWPSKAALGLPDVLSDLMSAHARLARTVAASAAGLTRDFGRAEEAGAALDERARLLQEQPAPPLDEVARMRTALASARRLRERLMTVAVMLADAAPAATTGPQPVVGAVGAQRVVGAVGQEPAAAGGVGGDAAPPPARPERDVGPIGTILDRVADYLEDGADDPAENADLDLGGLLADLDDHLDALARLRRAEVADGLEIDQTSPLRRSLLQTAGTRHALRSLADDATELRAVVAHLAVLPVDVRRSRGTGRSAAPVA